MQPAHQPVKVREARRDAGEAASPVVGGGGHVDRGGEGVRKADEALVVAAGLGELVEAPLDGLDLDARRCLGRGVERLVHHVLADRDQLAAHGKVEQRAPVVLGVDDGGGVRREAREVFHGGEVGDGGVAEERLHGEGGRHLARADQLAGDVVHLAVRLDEEVLDLEEIGNAVERLVVDEDRTEELLLDLDVLRCGARSLEGEMVDGLVHASPRLVDDS